MGDAHYRIRWARGELSGKVGRTRMCHAEKRVRFLGLFWLWWPLENANWRSSEAEAQRDIEDDVWLSAPLPAPTFQTIQALQERCNTVASTRIPRMSDEQSAPSTKTEDGSAP